MLPTQYGLLEWQNKGVGFPSLAKGMVYEILDTAGDSTVNMVTLGLKIIHYLKESHFPLKTHNRPLNVNCSRRMNSFTLLALYSCKKNGDPMMP